MAPEGPPRASGARTPQRRADTPVRRRPAPRVGHGLRGESVPDGRARTPGRLTLRGLLHKRTCTMTLMRTDTPALSFAEFADHTLPGEIQYDIDDEGVLRF